MLHEKEKGLDLKYQIPVSGVQTKLHPIGINNSGNLKYQIPVSGVQTYRASMFCTSKEKPEIPDSSKWSSNSVRVAASASMKTS